MAKHFTLTKTENDDILVTSPDRRPYTLKGNLSVYKTVVGVDLLDVTERIDDFRESEVLEVVHKNGDVVPITSIDQLFTECITYLFIENEGENLKSDLYRLENEAQDLEKDYTWLDPDRVDTIVYSSVSLGLTVTKTFTWTLLMGQYVVTKIELS